MPEGLRLLPRVFDLASSMEHLQQLVADLAWEEQRFTIYGHTVPMPRLIAMYGPVGYRYSGVVHPPRRLPPRLEAIRARVEDVAGRPFNSVLANLYRDGRDSVGWHRDSDYAHGGQPRMSTGGGRSRGAGLSPLALPVQPRAAPPQSATPGEYTRRARR